MMIRKGDYREILGYMLKQRSEGNEFVAFLDDSTAVHKEQLSCFRAGYGVLKNNN